MDVDRNRWPGRFVLTSSVDFGFIPRLAERLVGTLDVTRLHPLAQVEIQRQTPHEETNDDFLVALFGNGFPFYQCERLGHDNADIVSRGGYPSVVTQSTAANRENWHRNYIANLISFDVAEIRKIHSRDILTNLITAAVAQTARLYNVSALASTFELSRPTIIA